MKFMKLLLFLFFLTAATVTSNARAVSHITLANISSVSIRDFSLPNSGSRYLVTVVGTPVAQIADNSQMAALLLALVTQSKPVAVSFNTNDFSMTPVTTVSECAKSARLAMVLGDKLTIGVDIQASVSDGAELIKGTSAPPLTTSLMTYFTNICSLVK